MAVLGRKIEDALIDADTLGHSLLGIRLQEALDTWQELVDHRDRA